MLLRLPSARHFLSGDGLGRNVEVDLELVGHVLTVHNLARVGGRGEVGEAEAKRASTHVSAF